MKNADMPAMPFEIVDEVQSSRWWSGMTKREEFALKIMAGIYSNSAIIDDLSESSAKVVASAAARAADALLAELELKCQKP